MKWAKYILAGLGTVAILMGSIDWIATGHLIPYSHSYYLLVAGFLLLIPGGPDLAIIGIEWFQKR